MKIPAGISAFFVFILTLSLILTMNCFGQATQLPANSTIKFLDIVKDFGADPTGKKSSHEAFETAATFINDRHGLVDLFIPEGIYKVGKQLKKVKDKGNIIGYMGYDAFALEGCSNVTIRGISKEKTQIKLIDGMKYGSFDADGKKPIKSDDYNWYAHRSENGFEITKYFQNMATIGHIFKISNCTNISLKDFEINGNSGKCELGGNWSDNGRQIDADGIMILRSGKLSITNININEMGRDGILILDPDTKDTVNLKTRDIVFKNINIKYSGRNGISWCGGNNIEFNDCTVSFTGHGQIKSAPMAGIDIEPEASICKNGRFTNCNFVNNFNMGLASDRGEGAVKDSYNMLFTGCKFVQSSEDGYVTFLRGNANAFVFKECEFYGLSLNAVTAQSDNEATKYQNCKFQDCYNGAKTWNDINSYLFSSNGTRTVIDNCTFNSYFIAAFAIRGQNGKKCNEVDEASKTYIKNSTFNSYVPACTGGNCLQNGTGYAWLTRVLNNKFNYDSFPYIIDLNPGCAGSGITDEGKGFIQQHWPAGFKLPKCGN